MSPNNHAAVIYCRASTDEQASNDSLGEHARKHLFKVVDVFTEGFSGAKPDRPGMNKLSGRARKGRYQHLIVADALLDAEGLSLPHKAVAKWHLLSGLSGADYDDDLPAA